MAGHRQAVSVSATRAFPGGVTGSLSLTLQRDDRDTGTALFATPRSDLRRSVDLKVWHRDITFAGFAPQIEIGVEDNRSTLPLTDYTNRYLSLGLTRRF